MAYLFVIAAVLREVSSRDPNCVAALAESLWLALVVARPRSTPRVVQHRAVRGAAELGQKLDA